MWQCLAPEASLFEPCHGGVSGVRIPELVLGARKDIITPCNIIWKIVEVRFPAYPRLFPWNMRSEKRERGIHFLLNLLVVSGATFSRRRTRPRPSETLVFPLGELELGTNRQSLGWDGGEDVENND